MTHIDVMTVGNAVVDILAYVADDFLTNHSFIKGGMRLVESQETHKILEMLDDYKSVCGGSCANSAVGISSLGGRAYFVGRVKDDDLGHAFARSIGAHGVSYETPLAQDGLPTAHCVICVTPDAERSMMTFLGASTQLSLDDIKHAPFKTVRILFAEGYMWSAPQGRTVILEAVAQAQKAGAKIAFTLSDFNLVKAHQKELISFIKAHVDILFANEQEAMALGLSLDELAGLCERVALTKSAQGSIVMAGNKRFEIDAWAQDGVVDMTGAGDLYAAGFLYGMTHDYDLAQCGTLGAIAAQEVISHIGGQPKIALKEYIKGRM